jgi:hypothetical protein
MNWLYRKRQNQIFHSIFNLPALEDLTSLYQKLDGKTKKQILSCIFSEKVHFENGNAATPKYTPPIEVLINASKVLSSGKKKRRSKLTSFPVWLPLQTKDAAIMR